MAALGMSMAAVGPPPDDHDHGREHSAAANTEPRRPKRRHVDKLDVKKTVAGLAQLRDTLANVKFKFTHDGKAHRASRHTRTLSDRPATKDPQPKTHLLADSLEPSKVGLGDAPNRGEQPAAAPKPPLDDKQANDPRRKNLASLLSVYQNWAQEIAPRMSWHKFVLAMQKHSGNREIKLEMSDIREQALGQDTTRKRRRVSPALPEATEDNLLGDDGSQGGMGLVTGAPLSDAETPQGTHRQQQLEPTARFTAEDGETRGPGLDEVLDRVEKNRKEAMRLRSAREARAEAEAQAERDMEEARQAEAQAEGDNEDLEDELMRGMTST